MSQANDLTNRVERLETDNIDIKLAISSLIAVVERHQTNFEVIVSEIRALREDTRSMQGDVRTIQGEIRGIQTENRRILDYLLGEQSDDTSDS